MWAVITWPFLSFTRKVVLGRAWMTSPSVPRSWTTGRRSAASTASHRAPPQSVHERTTLPERSRTRQCLRRASTAHSVVADTGSNVQIDSSLSSDECLHTAGATGSIPVPPTSRVEDWRGKPLMGPRFQSPLIEPDMRISRIRLSDKASCGRPRTGLGEGLQPHQTQACIEVRVREAGVAVTPHLMLVA